MWLKSHDLRVLTPGPPTEGPAIFERYCRVILSFLLYLLDVKNSLHYDVYHMAESQDSPQPYLRKLEKRIKGAIIFYLTVLIADTFFILLSINGVTSGLTDIVRFGILCAIVIAAIFLLLSRINTLAKITKFNAWLDRRLFGVLEQSDAILSDILLSSAGIGDAPRPGVDPSKKADLAKVVVERLARHKQIFPGIMGTGIYTLWIWYWIVMYGTIVFSALTMLTFVAILSHVVLGMKPAFIFIWTLALAHIATTVAIGAVLKRMTQKTAVEISSSYGSDIEAYLREEQQA